MLDPKQKIQIYPDITVHCERRWQRDPQSRPVRLISRTYFFSTDLHPRDLHITTVRGQIGIQAEIQLLQLLRLAIRIQDALVPDDRKPIHINRDVDIVAGDGTYLIEMVLRVRLHGYPVGSQMLLLLGRQR